MPSAHRKVDAVDIQLMTECNLIGKYSYYGHVDIQLVWGILKYEQLKQNRESRNEIKGLDGIMHCSRCHVVLAAQPAGTRGRPREFCQDCEAARSRDRYRKRRDKIKSQQKITQKLRSSIV